MNLLERSEQKKEDWRKDINSGTESEEGDLEEIDLEREEEERQEEGASAQGFFGKPYMTTVLLGIIAVLLIIIIVLLLLMPAGRKQTETEVSGDQLQKNIADYAQEQQQNDSIADVTDDAIVIKPSEEMQAIEKDKNEKQEETEEAGEQYLPIADDNDKTAIVVDVEDENDVSYTKEFILNEALPYFADNNQAAIWDLAHLKRYVKLSEGLKDTGNYYYQGDVNADGKPNGKGLAIYEDNSYYYGDWVDGVRSGEGRWFRFYISQKNKTNAMGKYMAHSYSGAWANNLPNGEGAEHYEVDITKLKGKERILQNVVGNFTDGLYDGEMYANTIDYIGNVEEWDGVATKGVFTLWRDMSSIGECSVWRKRDDYTLCIDIDKSENKNQGIRELLKVE